jgi:glycosyltransferase involved in cell wall biosynthesis
MTKPLISIITASLNSGQTIGETLESVQRQTYSQVEHIVCDGGSIDETPEIIKSFQNAKNLHCICEPDRGIADALNKGLRYATGKYILVIQADDSLLGPEVLESLYPLLSTERVDVYSFPVIFDHPEKGKLLRKPIRFLWWNHFKFIFPHQGCFVHKRAFEKIGNFRTEFKICMDYDFFYRALAENLSVKFGNYPVALMGGAGVGSDTKFIYKRLAEEKLVQLQNEQNPGWKTAQFIFRLLYMQYKKYRLRLAVANKSEAN